MASTHWVKYPVWYAPDDDAEGERIAELADRLSATGIEMVGVFDRPPQQIFKRFGNKDHLSVAEAFLEPDLWQPAIDPLMIRLSLKIQWWQLGADEDESFIDYPDLEQKVREIRSYLKKYGQRIHVGLAWQWMYEMPVIVRPALGLPVDDRIAFVHPGRTGTIREPMRVQRHSNWVTLWPLPRETYDYQNARPGPRAADGRGEDRRHASDLRGQSVRSITRVAQRGRNTQRSVSALVHHLQDGRRHRVPGQPATTQRQSQPRLCSRRRSGDGGLERDACDRVTLSGRPRCPGRSVGA